MGASAPRKAIRDAQLQLPNPPPARGSGAPPSQLRPATTPEREGGGGVAERPCDAGEAPEGRKGGWRQNKEGKGGNDSNVKVEKRNRKGYHESRGCGGRL